MKKQGETNKIMVAVKKVWLTVSNALGRVTPNSAGNSNPEGRFSFTDQKGGNMFYSEEGREFNRLNCILNANRKIKDYSEDLEARARAEQRIEEIELELERLCQLHGVMIP